MRFRTWENPISISGSRDPKFGIEEEGNPLKFEVSSVEFRVIPRNVAKIASSGHRVLGLRLIKQPSLKFKVPGAEFRVTPRNVAKIASSGRRVLGLRLIKQLSLKFKVPGAENRLRRYAY
jgi:hypothetical protein